LLDHTPGERCVDEDIEPEMRAVDVDEIERRAFFDQVEQNTLAVAYELTHSRCVHQRDICSEDRLEVRRVDGIRLMLLAPGEGVHRGDEGLRQPPEEVARRQAFEGPDFEQSRRPLLELTKERFPARHVAEGPAVSEVAAVGYLCHEPLDGFDACGVRRTSSGLPDGAAPRLRQTTVQLVFHPPTLYADTVASGGVAGCNVCRP